MLDILLLKKITEGIVICNRAQIHSTYASNSKMYMYLQQIRSDMEEI